MGISTREFHDLLLFHGVLDKQSNSSQTFW